MPKVSGNLEMTAALRFELRLIMDHEYQNKPRGIWISDVYYSIWTEVIWYWLWGKSTDHATLTCVLSSSPWFTMSFSSLLYSCHPSQSEQRTQWTSMYALSYPLLVSTGFLWHISNCILLSTPTGSDTVTGVYCIIKPLTKDWSYRQDTLHCILLSIPRLLQRHSANITCTWLTYPVSTVLGHDVHCRIVILPQLSRTHVQHCILFIHPNWQDTLAL